MSVELTFHGGAGTVTGSCYELKHPGGSLMIDCGMFQGNKTLRELNYREFPFRAGNIDALIVTHAHIDHTGMIPKLYKHGFRGSMHATAPTLDLMTFMLPDSGHIQESEVERLNRRNKKRGRPMVEPVYTRKDAEACLELGQGHDMETWFEPMPGIRARFWNAGHILGSASVEIHVETGADKPTRILFSGDLGPDEKVFHLEPDAPEGFDYVLCESTYGDRERTDTRLEERREQLRQEIVDAHARGGNLVIPSFAVERTQEMMHDIGVLLAEGSIPPMPVFLDSPLASNATKVFIRHAHTLDDVALDEAELFRNPNFQLVSSVEDSKAIKNITGGAIIMAASGMCDAGRIKHHLKNNLWRHDATVLFVGYQAPGTLGSFIRDGAEKVRIHGHEIAVKCTVRTIGHYSAHADQGELIDWVVERLPIHHGLFLTHGDDDARTVMRDILIDKGLSADHVLMPQLDDSVTLATSGKPQIVQHTPRVDKADMHTDWHTDYATFMLDLGRRLEKGDAREKKALMQSLHQVLKR